MRTSLVIALTALCSVPCVASDWFSLERADFQGISSTKIHADVVTVDPEKVSIRLALVSKELGTDFGVSQASLQDLSRLRATAVDTKLKQWIILNGGFSSYRVDVPSGLLIIDSKTYSLIDRTKASDSNAGVPTRFSGFRNAGVLCQHGGTGAWDIIPVTDAPGDCTQAIQAGPVLVEPPEATIGISANEPSVKKFKYKRTVVCLTKSGKLRLIVTEDETFLRPLAEWLVKSDSDGGMDCRAAINLSGDSSSGMAIKEHGEEDEPQFVGDGTFPIPSVLIVEPRKVDKKAARKWKLK